MFKLASTVFVIASLVLAMAAPNPKPATTSSHTSSATTSSHTSSATTSSHTSSATTSSHTSSATTLSHTSSATTLSHTSSATTSSHTSSATTLSHTSSATTSSHASSATTSSHTSSATTPAKTSLPQIARFENQPGLPALASSPIGIYLDIFWQGMSLVETAASTVQLPGLVPNSPPNCAAFGPTNTVTIMQGTPEMTTMYAESTVSSLTLHSFYYGCVVATEESLTSDTDSCNVTITGFSSAGTQVAKQTFAFVADGLSQQMVQAKPTGFTNVQSITFAFVSEALGGNGAATLIDSVAYDVM